MSGFAIAIDGPVGVGKSSVAQEVAKTLGMTYIDTGAMYRAVAFYEMNNSDKAAPIESMLKAIDIRLELINGLQHIYLNGKDVTKLIRTQEVSEAASRIAALKPVREKLVAMQQDLAKHGRVVMDGRDIASKVLPWAQVKIYLDADPKIRAERRLEDLRAKGTKISFEEILEQTKIRDNRDMNRVNSPLICTDDAICIDTGGLSQPEVADKIVRIVRERGGGVLD